MKCAKISEGVYGEVFRTINKHKQAVALKANQAGLMMHIHAC
jgi:hypothetical protein